jgi:hypothetical protein
VSHGFCLQNERIDKGSQGAEGKASRRSQEQAYKTFVACARGGGTCHFWCRAKQQAIPGIGILPNGKTFIPTPRVGIMLDEAHIPVNEEVKGAC